MSMNQTYHVCLRVLNPLELELYMVVNHHVGLVAESGSSAEPCPRPQNSVLAAETPAHPRLFEDY